MTLSWLSAGIIAYLATSRSVIQVLAEAVPQPAAVNPGKNFFALAGRALGRDNNAVDALDFENAARLLPRDTVTTTVVVTVCEPTLPATHTLVHGSTSIETPPPGTAIPPPNSHTPSVPGTPPAVTPPMSSNPPPAPSVSSGFIPPPEIPLSSEVTMSPSSGPPASETTGSPPAPVSGPSSETSGSPPGHSGSSTVTVPARSSPSTATAPPASSTSLPPAPNSGSLISYDRAIAMAGVIFAAFAAL